MLNLYDNYLHLFNKPEIDLLFISLERYFNGAILQINRVINDQKSPHRKISNSHKLFLDAHFYFICLGQINRFLGMINGELNNAGIRIVFKQFSKDFSNEIRNDLEHLNERAVGKIKGKSVPSSVKNAWYNDFTNFYGDNFSFGGKQYPINKAQLNKLTKYYKSIIAIIHKEYALKDENFIRMHHNRINLRRIIASLATNAEYKQ